MLFADLDGDGRLDFFTAAYHGRRRRDVDSRIYYGGEDKMFRRDGVQLIRTYSATDALSGDFNGDGYIDLAVRFGITKYYLCHIFKKHIGYSVIQYINIQRLLYFRKHYISDMNMDILAMQAGFKSYCLFYKVFRKEYGMAPGKGMELFGKSEKL